MPTLYHTTCYILPTREGSIDASSPFPIRQPIKHSHHCYLLHHKSLSSTITWCSIILNIIHSTSHFFKGIFKCLCATHIKKISFIHHLGNPFQFIQRWLQPIKCFSEEAIMVIWKIWQPVCTMQVHINNITIMTWYNDVDRKINIVFEVEVNFLHSLWVVSWDLSCLFEASTSSTKP